MGVTIGRKLVIRRGKKYNRVCCLEYVINGGLLWFVTSTAAPIGMRTRARPSEDTVEV